MNYTKYIYVNGEKIYVSDDIYRAYKQQKNHEEYLKRRDYKFIEYNFSGNHNLEEIKDERMDVEEIVETRIFIKQLQKAIQLLKKEEREIIEKIYFKGYSLRLMASERNISHPALMKKRDKILKKLRETIWE
jgi:hypothetical protein